ncbi:MAG: molybdopterin-guanine dinucleotide biosynthesis protein B [candidate division Zixibacteria bacterium]
MPVYLQIVGRKNSGKTRLIENLTRELVNLGYKVATVKHTSHDHEFDRPETDSWKHRKAGSEATIILSPNRWVCHAKTLEPDTQRILEDTLFRDKDIVICEGYREEGIATIECVMRGRELIFGDNPNLIAMISEGEANMNIPVFGPGEIGKLANWIVRKFGLSRSN